MLYVKGSLALLIFSVASFGQVGNDRLQVDFNGSLAVPVGDFASSSDGMALTGIGLSVATMRSITPELSVGGEGGIIINTLDAQTFANDLQEETGASEVTVAGGTYFNTPALVTFQYSPAFYSKHGISFYAGLGVDFLYMMDLDIEVDGQDLKMTFDPGPALAWSVGWQMALGKVLLGVRYLDLGEHTIKGKVSSDAGEESYEGTQKVAIVNFLVGYRF